MNRSRAHKFEDGREEPFGPDIDPGKPFALADQDRERNSSEKAGQDRARQEGRKYPEPTRHKTPTASASSAANSTRSIVTPGGATIPVRTAASTVIVAASGPTINCREGPKKYIGYKWSDAGHKVQYRAKGRQ